ncbi:MAG: hypothetical protein QE267_04620 [Akkermansiaceae bacterium]|nr:hypothetical protein [Akkermansiaceae bacterium]
MNIRTFDKPARGFALIVTLSLMILLTVIAVGLLTLSSISLRSSSQGSAMAAARANARMALMLALGELQKNAGPDQRITARADVIDEAIAQSKLTGIWQSLEIKSSTTSSEYDKTSRDLKFKSWLTSTGTPADAASLTFASKAPLSTTAPTNSPAAVTLWGTGTVGKGDPDAPKRLVIANKVDITSSPGALAWAVMDEGLKARINTPYDETANTDAMATAQLGTGKRPATEFMAGLTTLTRPLFETKSASASTIKKGISPNNFSLAATQLAGPTISTALKALAHDVTTSSAGIFTDTARGGLRQDIHLLTNSGTLPSEYSGKGIYASRSLAPSGGSPSDPQWESLSQFATLYKDTAKLTKDSSGAPLLTATAPSSWEASTPGKTLSSMPTVNRESPQGAVLMPTIAKVQMLFSLILRDFYPNLAGPAPSAGGTIITRRLSAAQKASSLPGRSDVFEAFKSTIYEYELHLMYTPIVTLCNPYNVAIEFDSMDVQFIGIPFAMKVFRNGVALSNDFVPLELMTANNTVDNRDQSKIFSMALKTKKNEKPDSTTFRLLPGEVKIFSPFLDPKFTWAKEVANGGGMFWDNHLSTTGTSLTSSMEGMPGWRGFGLGYSVDWLGTIGGAGMHMGHVIGVAVSDKLNVEFTPLGIPRNNNKFVVQMAAKVGKTIKKVSAIEMNYESSDGVQKLLEANGGSKTMRYPKTGTLDAWNLRDSANTPIGEMAKVTPFAILTAQAKTTSSGRDSSYKDGRFAGKPWSFAHANIGSSSQNMVTESPANHSHELDLLSLQPTDAADLVSVDGQDRTNFITGNTNTNGTKFGTTYDIPLAPVQTLAELNGANPGGSSGYLPRFAQPIGNSWAHPLISPSNISESGPSGYNYLDHSFLLNTALYDGFYFSGLADQTGSFGGSGTTSQVLAKNLASDGPLTDPRMMLTPPSGKDKTEFTTAIKQATAYKSVAAWQSMAGAFNINSTSVQAWKAMLASIHDAQANVNQRSGTGTSLTSLKATAAGSARISRFRLPSSPSAADGGDPKDAYWMGTREYSDAELQTLAENIVKQVRLRGPFLSMADFVNRRLGTESDKKAQSGALQQAIDESNLNKSLATSANAGFEIPATTATNYKYKNATAGTGPSYQGAPGYLSQADILNVLGNAATARSDTFTIRGYGESRDASGKMVATATCEAVVQRITDWIDSSDAAETPIASLTSANNKNFGRRYKIASFRWLNSTEI